MLHVCVYVHMHMCCVCLSRVYNVRMCACASPSQNGCALLHTSVSYEHTQLTQYLLAQHHMDVNLQDNVRILYCISI